MISEEEARMIEKEAAELTSVPIENEPSRMERRAACLRFAIETKNVALSLKNDGSVLESAHQVLEAAAEYLKFVEGGVDA